MQVSVVHWQVMLLLQERAVIEVQWLVLPKVLLLLQQVRVSMLQFSASRMFKMVSQTGFNSQEALGSYCLLGLNCIVPKSLI